MVLTTPGTLRVHFESCRRPPAVLCCWSIACLVRMQAFNTIGAEHMRDPSGRLSFSRGTDMLFAGSSDAATLAIATDVVRGVGFTPIHVGPLRYARNLEAIAELWIHMAVRTLHLVHRAALRACSRVDRWSLPWQLRA